LGAIGDEFTTLVRGTPNGGWKSVADIGQYEADNNPDGGQAGTQVDSNPNSVAALPGGRAVVDAGANDLLWVDAAGNPSLLCCGWPMSTRQPARPHERDKAA